MNTVLYAHVPSLQIDRPEVSFAGGRLVKLPFDEWIALESEFEYEDRKYNQAEPVFWISNLRLGEELTQEALVKSVDDVVWPVHIAFLLDERAPLIPTPTLSSCYIATDGAGELADTVQRLVTRLIGPMEREFIAYGSPLTYQYTAEDLAVVEQIYHQVQSSGISDWSGDVRAAIDVLEETARPDSWYGGDMVFCRLHGFIRCMSATESILLPLEAKDGGGITQTFGRYAAALLAPAFESREVAAEHFADLYRFRSSLMHGRSMPDQQDPAVAAKLREGNLLLRHIAYAALILRKGLADTTPLWTLLKDSWENPESHKLLVSTLKEGGQA